MDNKDQLIPGRREILSFDSPARLVLEGIIPFEYISCAVREDQFSSDTI